MRECLAKGNEKPKKNRGVKKKKAPKIPDKVSIEDRPKEANERLEIGHFEADSVLSKKGGSGAALNIIIERKSRKMFITKVPDLSAEDAITAMMKVFEGIPESKRKTVTTDNGTEFYRHAKLHGLGMKTYFCHPYSSWERGTNENHNRLVRRFFPKKTDFKNITEKDIKEIEDFWNNMPRAILNYKTPNQVWEESK
jgi:IS30 family transposase